MNGSNIQSLRNSLGWTQSELSLVLGVHPMTVSKAERSLTSLPPSALRFISALETLSSLEPARDMALVYVRSGQPLRALGLALSLNPFTPS